MIVNGEERNPLKINDGPILRPSGPFKPERSVDLLSRFIDPPKPVNKGRGRQFYREIAAGALGALAGLGLLGWLTLGQAPGNNTPVPQKPTTPGTAFVTDSLEWEDVPYDTTAATGGRPTYFDEIVAGEHIDDLSDPPSLGQQLVDKYGFEAPLRVGLDMTPLPDTTVVPVQPGDLLEKIILREMKANGAEIRSDIWEVLRGNDGFVRKVADASEIEDPDTIYPGGHPKATTVKIPWNELPEGYLADMQDSKTLPYEEHRLKEGEQIGNILSTYLSKACIAVPNANRLLWGGENGLAELVAAYSGIRDMNNFSLSDPNCPRFLKIHPELVRDRLLEEIQEEYGLGAEDAGRKLEEMQGNYRNSLEEAGRLYARGNTAAESRDMTGFDKSAVGLYQIAQAGVSYALEHDLVLPRFNRNAYSFDTDEWFYKKMEEHGNDYKGVQADAKKELRTEVSRRTIGRAMDAHENRLAA